MGVNWQKNDYYQGLKDYEKECGLSLAERNAIQNPYGNHSFGGLLISQLLPQLIVGGTEKLAGGLNGTMPEDEGIDVKLSSSSIRDFTQAKKMYDEAKRSGNTKKQEKWAAELIKIGEEHSGDNGNPTIKNGYKSIENSLSKYKKA